MAEGVNAFKEIIPLVLTNQYLPFPQPVPSIDQIHYSRDVPNNGILNMAWSICRISAFLRSLDYGPVSIMPAPKLTVLGSEYLITNYKILKSTEAYMPQMIVETERAVFYGGDFFIELGLKRSERN
jgi:hypothetical protein